MPFPLDHVSLAYWAVEAGKTARTLAKSFKALAPEAESVLEDLPWELL